jgi:hypothetical protein
MAGVAMRRVRDGFTALEKIEIISRRSDFNLHPNSIIPR